MIRDSSENHLHRFKALTNQYWVDMYAKIEMERLLYLRLHQKDLRCEEYIHLQDALNKDGDVNPRDLGQVTILPSSFLYISIPLRYF